MEPTIKLYETQHARALECVQTVENLAVSAAAVAEKSQEIRLVLARMAGILKPHLISEDRLVYPRLMSDPDSTTALLAQRYWKEMGELSQVILAYLAKWGKAGALEHNADDFIAESKSVFGALAKRIAAEENELYPILRSRSLL